MEPPPTKRRKSSHVSDERETIAYEPMSLLGPTQICDSESLKSNTTNHGNTSIPIIEESEPICFGMVTITVLCHLHILANFGLDMFHSRECRSIYEGRGCAH